MGMIERKCKVCERNKFKVKREPKQEDWYVQVGLIESYGVSKNG